MAFEIFELSGSSAVARHPIKLAGYNFGIILVLRLTDGLLKVLLLAKIKINHKHK